MDTKYHKAANVASGCKANPNVDSLLKYKNDWGNQQHPKWGTKTDPGLLLWSRS